MDYEYLNISKSERMCVVEINRPPVNALNSDLCIELSQLFLDLEIDPEVGVIIVTGAGKAFEAGADISEMESMS